MLKTIGDINRVINEGKPRSVVQKFIESYRSGLGPDDIDLSVPIENELDSIEFKNNRNKFINSATVTISTGKTFDADEVSIKRMSEVVQAVKEATELGMITNPDVDYPLKWVLADAESGKGTRITFNELREALVLANQNRATAWLR